MLISRVPKILRTSKIDRGEDFFRVLLAMSALKKIWKTQKSVVFSHSFLSLCLFFWENVPEFQFRFCLEVLSELLPFFLNEIIIGGKIFCLQVVKDTLSFEAVESADAKRAPSGHFLYGSHLSIRDPEISQPRSRKNNCLSQYLVGKNEILKYMYQKISNT